VFHFLAISAGWSTGERTVLTLQSCAKVSLAAVKMLDGRDTIFALLSGRTGRDRKMHLNRES
jgi:hypothetical protein